MKQPWVQFLIVLGIFLFLSHAKLASASDAPATTSDRIDYTTGVGKKLGRGLSNVAFGWLEVPKGIQDVGDQNNFIAAITWGPLVGVGKAVVRTVAGAYEVLTFPVPAPNNFQPLVQPEFMLGDQW